MSDAKEEKTPKKKGKMGKMLMLVGGLVVLVGGGVGAGVYAASSGMIGGGHAEAEEPNVPKLVPKSEQKHASDAGEGGGHGGDEGESAPENHGKPTPAGSGGDQYASTYYSLEKDFTSNLRDSSSIVQLGLAVSTPYDDKVIENLKDNDIAVRSAVLMTLGDTPEEQVTSSEGKKQLQARLAAAINATLKQKEGFGGVGNVYFTSFVVQ